MESAQEIKSVPRNVQAKSQPRIKNKKSENRPNTKSKYKKCSKSKKLNKKIGNKTVKKQWECYKCKLKVKTSRVLYAHLKEHNDATPNECICGMFFSTQQLYRHLCAGNSVQCEYCPETFGATCDILRHLGEAHKAEVVMSRCTEPRCNKLFAMKILLDWHIEFHRDKDKAMMCEECGETFWTNYCYSVHMMKHSDERPHQCTECEQKFRQLSHLKDHLKTHSSNTKSIACPKCPKPNFFRSVRNLRIHMDVHNDVKYSCNVCLKTYDTLGTLNSHRSIHAKYFRVFRIFS